MNERTCAHEYDMRAREGGRAGGRQGARVLVDGAHTHSLCKRVCEFLPGGTRLLRFSLCMCRQRKSSSTTGCIMKSEELVGELIRVSKPAFLPFCLCAFVWWPSKASIAILASHRIGLLYKNTLASSLQGWSGARGVGAAGGDGGKHWMFVRNFPFASFLIFLPSQTQVADVVGARGICGTGHLKYP